MIASWLGLSAWISAWTIIFITIFCRKQNSWSPRWGAKPFSPQDVLESTFYKMSPGNVGQLWSSSYSELPDIHTEGQQKLSWSCGWYPRTSTGFWGGFVGTNQNLAELLPPLGTNGQWESDDQWELEEWQPFFFFFLFLFYSFSYISL